MYHKQFQNIVYDSLSCSSKLCMGVGLEDAKVRYLTFQSTNGKQTEKFILKTVRMLFLQRRNQGVGFVNHSIMSCKIVLV